MSVSIPDTILLVFALGCFILGATNFVAGENRGRIISLGLALATLALIIP